MIFRELNPEEFNAFAKTYNPSSFYQTSEYGLTMSMENYYSYYLGLINNDKIVAATFVMIKTIGSYKYGYAPRGYLIDYNDYSLLAIFSKEIRKYLNEKGIVAIKLNPSIVKTIYDKNYNLIANNPNYDNMFNNLNKLNYNHLGYNNSFEAFKPRFEAIIELKKDYFTLFKNMDKRFKTKVRSAENNGVRIHKGGYNNLNDLFNQTKGKYPRDLNYFQNLYNNFDKTKSIEIYYAKLEPAIYLKKNQLDYLKVEEYSNKVNDEVIKNQGKSHQKLLNKKMEADKSTNLYHERLVNAINLSANYPNGIILATVLVVKVKDMVTIVMDSYDKKYNSFNAKHLIIWKLIEKFAKEGYHYFNLGGITGKVDKNNKYYGLNTFKLGFGSYVYEYIGDYEFVTNKPLYIMYRNTAPLFKKE